jgi:signal transduction histidine kinase/ActR/RegA family two-component response regulator
VSLRTLLLLLVLATGLPIAAFGLLSAASVVDREQSAYEAAIRDRNRAFMSAVDAELNGHVQTLRALAGSRALAGDDIRDFYEAARNVLETQAAWTNITLHAADGRQLMNLAMAWGSALPERPYEPRSFELALKTQAPAIGNIIGGAPSGPPPSIPVRMPLVRSGHVVYILTALVRPESFQSVLTKQQLPAGWVSGLVDGNGRFIARVPARPVGSMAGDEYRAHVRQSPEGWYRGRTVEGLDTYTAHTASHVSEWTVGYAIPADLVLASARHAAWTMALGAAICLAIALTGALLLGRRITRPMSQLASQAPNMGSGAPLAPIRSAIRELDALARALKQASEAIRARDQELQQRAAELQRADVHKTQFLATLSHELRNPLAPIANGLALLERQQGEAAAQTRAMMNRQMAHLRRLIDDLLDVSRIDRGKLDLRRDRIAIDAVVASAIETVKPSMDAKSQRLVVRYAPEPLAVDGDLVRLSQVLANILHNAAKFTPNGGLIEVATASEGGDAVVKVTDSGAGFEPGEAERMFEMFVQLESTRGHAAGGLGLGLTLARSLVDMHGGRIEAASAGIGRGAQFTVRLPLAAASARASAAPEQPADRALRRRRILVVDDNADAADSLAALLRVHGMEARACYDSEQALEVAAEFKPDLAFLDLSMPGMGGIELGRKLREQARERPLALVALTGMGQKADIEETQAAGFAAHLTKPAAKDAVLRIAVGLTENVVAFSPDSAKKSG